MRYDGDTQTEEAVLVDWVAGISKAIDYIEGHLDGKLTMEEIAGQALLSPCLLYTSRCV